MFIKYRFIGTWHYREITDSYPEWRYLEYPEDSDLDIETYIKHKDDPDSDGYWSYRSHSYRIEYSKIDCPPKAWLDKKLRNLTKHRDELNQKIEGLTSLYVHGHRPKEI